ncbi:efflux RND transporter periplasmic adaptor subunit [Glacieibacterium megasporae]|uniref:efflux RND transporter periplasmic adaptor subunit n=1 Tax=Glacieibacterium megasporae TaxID=2835787 RepID=UPI001C1E4087|nr:efflux RND transporter periplasmic adaptor subunit [Polymorphobacter megasporae]UAJ11522.1 efflux RND transporter periplasmic adaptor subunit [Polymorphobacter megasporae]
MKSVPRFATRAFLGIALAMLAGCGKKKEDKGPPPTPEAGYVVLRAETVPLFIELTGRTAAFETSDVRPQVAGLILARTFTEGSVVHAGQTLYKIDPSQYRAALAQAQANLSSAQANAAATKAKADRYKPLADMQAVAKQDYVDARGTADQAAASVSQNRAAVETAKINLGFTNIPAPITGRIGRSLVTTGGLVTVGQTTALTTIQRLDPIFVDIQQSSADLLSLRRSLASGGRAASSAAVRLELADGSEYAASGRVEFAEAVVDPNTGTVTLRARFPNHQGVLLPGMFVRARLSQQTAQNAILAPQTGISRDPKGNATALVVGKDNKAVSRDVKLDRTVGDKWLVASGLAAGDKLIVEGINRIKPGQAIKPVAAGSKPAPRPAANDDRAKS